MLTPATFREQYTEFKDPGIYPDAAILLNLTVATTMLDPVRWAGMLDAATGLWVAHFLTLSARDGATVFAGGLPGAVQGVLTSKSVDKVAASYDATTVTLTDAGFWNMTRYGIQLYQWVQMFGAGGIQLTGNC